MTQAFFEKIRKVKISSWSLSSFMLEATHIVNFPPDWKWIFCEYIPSLEYVGSTAFDEDDNRYDDWSMPSRSCTALTV
jgi:hypothetical protein